MGLFLSHSSLNLERYSKACVGTVVNLLSKSSRVLRLGKPLKAPTSILRMRFLLSCKISRCRRCLKVSVFMTWMLFSCRLRYRVLIEMLSGTSTSSRRVQMTRLAWLLQEQAAGQDVGEVPPQTSDGTQRKKRTRCFQTILETAGASTGFRVQRRVAISNGHASVNSRVSAQVFRNWKQETKRQRYKPES